MQKKVYLCTIFADKRIAIRIENSLYNDNNRTIKGHSKQG